MDYATTIGTLNFAVNETSKSFAVPIIDDLYQEGPETINLTLSNPVGATLDTPNPAQVTITDKTPGRPPRIRSIMPTRDSLYANVRQHYLDFLSRSTGPGLL